MYPTGHRNPVWRDDIQFHAVFVHLGELRGGRNGERKGARGLPIAKRSGHVFACSASLRFLLEELHVATHLLVGRQGDGGSGVLVHPAGGALEFGMLGNSGH